MTANDHHSKLFLDPPEKEDKRRPLPEVGNDEESMRKMRDPFKSVDKPRDDEARD